MIPGYPLLFSTSTVAAGNMSFRVGDAANTLANRQRFLKQLELSYESCVAMQCDHGDTILVVDETSSGQGATTQETMLTAEALLTNSPTISLMLLTADCVPAIVYDPTHHAVALVHLNRKTIAHKLASRVIEKMKAVYQSNAADVLVWFEPHIHHHNYRFKLPLPAPLIPELENYSYKNAGHIHIDFAKAHYDELMSAGVPETNISVSPIDVWGDETYFSHTARKQGTRPEGRHATVVSLKT